MSNAKLHRTPPHLYRMYDEEGLIYIGSTIRFWKRLAEHRRQSWWAQSVVRVRAEIVNVELPVLRKLERKAIYDEMPRWNVSEQTCLIPFMDEETFADFMDRWLTNVRAAREHHRWVYRISYSDDPIPKRFDDLLRRWRMSHGEPFDLSMLKQVA